MKDNNLKADKLMVAPSHRLKLIIGIGNPRKQYKNSYHNAGFLAVDYLKEKIPACRFLKSESYMNDSGLFVVQMLKKTGIKPQELLIVHDDSDIELGKSKLGFGRGSAGHKGISSIISSLKTKNFWRLRIGIRSKVRISAAGSTRRLKAEDFVLKTISKKDEAVLEKTLEQALSKIQAISA